MTSGPLSGLTTALRHRFAGRVDLEEFEAVAERLLAGVELDQNPIGIAEESTPYSRLSSSVTIARDFREAGSGAAWDRVRSYATKIYGWPANKSRGQSRGRRAWSTIDTVALHTAGTAGMHADRWLGVPTHDAIASGGEVVLCHHHDAYLWAAHALNRRSISLEIAGDRTITPEQIEPARALIRYMVEDLRHRRGDGATVYLSPHIHGHSSRVRDCDPAIWQAVGEWALDTLGLEVGEVMGSGRPIPSAWWSSGHAPG